MPGRTGNAYSPIHRKGSGVAGIYSRDVAETKVQETMDFAKQNGMPLLVTSEPE